MGYSKRRPNISAGQQISRMISTARFHVMVSRDTGQIRQRPEAVEQSLESRRGSIGFGASAHEFRCYADELRLRPCVDTTKPWPHPGGCAGGEGLERVLRRRAMEHPIRPRSHRDLHRQIGERTRHGWVVVRQQPVRVRHSPASRSILSSSSAPSVPGSCTPEFEVLGLRFPLSQEKSSAKGFARPEYDGSARQRRLSLGLGRVLCINPPPVKYSEQALRELCRSRRTWCCWCCWRRHTWRTSSNHGRHVRE